MCCLPKYGLLGLLVSMMVGRGGCCPTDVPVDVTLSVTPAAITEGGEPATLTASIAAAYTEDVTLQIRGQQTPETSSPVYELSDSSIVIPAGQTEGSLTVTALALPADVESVDVVLRVSQVSVPGCEWDVDVAADPLVVGAGGGSLQVTLCPDDAIASGAQWNVDGGAWQDSGATVAGLSPGTHTVNYNTIKGWVSPPSEDVEIVEGETTQVTQCYDP